MFGKKCGHEAVIPFRVRCAKAPGHSGSHGARGLTWGADGKIRFGGRRKTTRR